MGKGGNMRCFNCNIQLLDKAVSENGESFCSYVCVDKHNSSKNEITIHGGDVYPKMYRVDDSECYKSKLCLCFFDDLNGGLQKGFGYYGKLEQMEPIWENTSEEPMRNPVHWCYASSLDSLIKSK